MKFEIMETLEFKNWFEDQPLKTQTIVIARLQRIAFDGHFGWTNTFDGLIELKWKSGMRIYTFQMDQTIVVVLFGGNKNGQTYDINQA